MRSHLLRAAALAALTGLACCQNEPPGVRAPDLGAPDAAAPTDEGTSAAAPVLQLASGEAPDGGADDRAGPAPAQAIKPPLPPKPAEPAPPPTPGAQEVQEAALLRSRIETYFQGHVGRRIYLQTDKPLYKPGETIWLKVWDLKTRSLDGDHGGSGMHVELVSPRGAVVLKRLVREQHGGAQADLPIGEGMAGGEYTLRVRTTDGQRGERPVVVQSYEAPRLQMKLEFLRKAYGVSDEVTATIAVRRATGEPLADHVLTGLVRLDGRDLPQVPVRTDDSGEGLVRFQLPSEIAEGEGLLTVLAEDGGLTESVAKRVPIIVSKLSLSSFPEGGQLVEGLPGRVYFEARTPLGKPADISGRVVDDQGQLVSQIVSVRDGMGRFDLTPAAGRSYHIEIDRPAGVAQRYPVDQALAAGCGLRSFDDLDGELGALRVAVRCTERRRVTVGATLRENFLDAAAVDVPQGAPAVVYLEPRGTAAAALLRAQGAARVTVFDEQMNPLAERLIYRNRRARLAVQIEPDRAARSAAVEKGYAPRDQVVLAVTTTDPAGQPVAAEVGLSVADDTVLTFADDKTGQMLSRLYLEPELQGKLEEPNFYFDLSEEKSALGLDLLMGTRGWRKFEWQPVLKTLQRPRPETVASGTPVPDFGGLAKKKTAATAGVLKPLELAADPAKAAPATPTPEPVRPGAPPPPPAPMHAQAEPAATVPAQQRMAKDEEAARPAKADRAVTEREGAEKAFADKKVPAPAERRAAKAEAAPPAEMAQKEAPADDLRAGPRPMNQPAAKPMVMAAHRRAPAPDAPAQVARAPMGGGGTGEAMNGTVGKGRAMDLDLGGDGMMGLGRLEQGGQRGRLAIAVRPRPVIQYAPVRVFPMPNYRPGSFAGPRTDFRETLAFQPAVRTGKDGKATVSFPLSDAITAFRVVAEGVGAGAAGRGEAIVRSSLPFSMAVKVPLSVSEGDHIELPLQLSNERGRPLSVDLAATFGDLLVLDRPVARTKGSLAAGARESLFYPLTVTGKRGKSQLRFVASADGLQDEFVRQVVVSPRGFPQHSQRSGQVRDRFVAELELGEILPGTVDGKLRLYPSPVASMVGGLEGLLQEPGGCFEQASSTNYPNVMILRYLKQQHHTDPALLGRTSQLLDIGYKRLVGYETPHKGYEWFGAAPANEALTAYGLLEFTDMQEVYADVDREMLRRTAAWLRQRRDGKGGYQRDSKAVDSFGRASKEVTDAYITYGLTEARQGGLDEELAQSEHLARDTGDSYILALATGSLLNAGRRDAGQAAAERLVHMQDASGGFLGAGHSITRSGGESLHVETTALAVMSLLKAGKDEPVRRGVEWLVGHRGGYGQWGSTQGTVLALKALTAYALASRRTQTPGDVTLRINGAVAGRQHYEAGRRAAIVFAGLDQHLRQGKNQVEIVHEAPDGAAPLPFSLGVDYRALKPASSPQAVVELRTALERDRVGLGESVRLNVSLRNRTDAGQPMTLVRVGLPGGLSFQTWQLKELRDKGLVAFYETGPSEVILYLRQMKPREEVALPLDLLATVPGRYTGQASRAYLYYTSEHKTWVDGVQVTITP